MNGKRRGNFFIDLLEELIDGIVEFAGEVFGELIVKATGGLFRLVFELLVGIFDGL